MLTWRDDGTEKYRDSFLRVMALARHKIYSLLSSGHGLCFHFKYVSQKNVGNPCHGGSISCVLVYFSSLPLKGQPEEEAMHPVAIKGNRKLTINLVN